MESYLNISTESFYFTFKYSIFTRNFELYLMMLCRERIKQQFNYSIIFRFNKDEIEVCYANVIF